MTAKTPVHQLEYLVEGEPIRTTRAVMQRNAETIEAALIRGPASSPTSQSLATLSGEVNLIKHTAAGWTAFASTIVTAGWTLGTMYGVTSAYRVINGVRYLRIAVTRNVGAGAITVGADGNMADTTVAMLPAAARWPYPVTGSFHRNGIAEGSARMRETGEVQAASYIPSQTIPEGAELFFLFAWPTT